MRTSLAWITAIQLPNCYSSYSSYSCWELYILQSWKQAGYAQSILVPHFVVLNSRKQSPMLLCSGWSLPNQASPDFEPLYWVEKKSGMKTWISRFSMFGFFFLKGCFFFNFHQTLTADPGVKLHWINSKPSNRGQERRIGLWPAAAPSSACLIYCAVHRCAQSYGKNNLIGTWKAKVTGQIYLQLGRGHLNHPIQLRNTFCRKTH